MTERHVKSTHKITCTPAEGVRRLLNPSSGADLHRDVAPIARRLRKLAAELELDAAGVYALAAPLLDGLCHRKRGLASGPAAAELIAGVLEREKRRRAAARVEEPLT